MKRYVIKDVIVNLENPEKILVYYTGVDGYVYEDPEYVDGYRRRINAEKKILKDVNDSFYGRNEKVNENVYIEAKQWLHHLSIVEIEI